MTNIIALREVTENGLVADMDLPAEVLTVKIPFPCLITVEKGIFEPRLPSYKLKKATQNRPVRILTLDDMPDKDPVHYGLNGSPTRVKRIFPPENNQTQERWTDSEEQSSEKLFRFLKDGKFLQQPR